MLDTAPELFVRESRDAYGRVVDARAPVLAADGDPDLGWHLIGKAVERESRSQADDTLWDKPCRLGERLLWVECGIGKLVQPAGQANQLAGLFHAADRGGSDASLLKLRQPCHPPPLVQRQRLRALRGDVVNWHGKKARMNQLDVRGVIPHEGESVSSEYAAIRRTAQELQRVPCCQSDGAEAPRRRTTATARHYEVTSSVSYALIGTQLQNRLRSPCTLSTRPTGDQYFWRFRLLSG
jgi:hypothetical protein